MKFPKEAIVFEGVTGGLDEFVGFCGLFIETRRLDGWWTGYDFYYLPEEVRPLTPEAKAVLAIASERFSS